MEEAEEHRPTATVGIWVTLGVVGVGVVVFAAYNLIAAVFGPYPSTPTDSTDGDVEKRDIRLRAKPPAATLKISHSLPEINLGAASAVDRDKVVRQSTLPVVPTRHLNLQRQFNCCSVSALGHVRPELYPQPDTARSCNGDAICEPSGGRLHFALRYDHDVEGLVVKVLQAMDLTPRDFNGCRDPYIKVHLLPDRKKKFQTKVQRRNRNPVFNETFVFPLAYSQLPSTTLQFSVYDLDRFSRHDLVGQVTVRGLVDNCDLSHEVQYIVDVVKCEREDRGKCVLGELMVSLCYLPTAGRLTATIIKARNLKARQQQRPPDPYVKVWMVCHGQRVKKKKTTVKKATSNPVYNEALVFDVPADIAEDVCLVIKVIDYDRVGSNEALGCCTIGTQHWLEMLDGPRKPVAQWYPLTETVADYGRPSTVLHRANAVYMGCLNGR